MATAQLTRERHSGAGRGRVWRHRPRAVIGGVAAVAAFALAGTSGIGVPDAHRGVEAQDTTVTFSMTVQPGEPVPMQVVRDQTASQFGDRPGQGIDIAMIDTGVTPVRGLDQPGKVLHGPDLSNEGGLANLRNLDTYGHGTHLAGIMVGDDGDQVLGLAPSSRLVSLKVAGATGETNVAQVVAAIDWVIEHRQDPGVNIRVLNLSLGVPSVGTHVGDRLAAAVERAWKAGIVVVAAAGNRGNASGRIDSPAISPYVVAVGGMESFDSWGSGDSMATWSSSGDGVRDPNVIAAGRSIQSFRVPGSMLDQLHPTARVGSRYFRGTGTSQSAAVVSGLAAALLSSQPSLTADQVKYLLTSEAADIAPGTILDGSGRIDPKMSGKKSGTAWKAPMQVFTSAASGLDPNGLPVLMPTTNTWTGGTWNGASWAGGTWSGASWAGASWAGASWAGASWAEVVAGASWAGASWAGASWAGASWAGASWAGASWAGASWAGASWAGEGWR